MTQTGQIIRSLSGFYDIEEKETHHLFRTRARGQFRLKNKTPLVGDYVYFEAGELDGEGFIVDLLERKNEMRRPPVSNVDFAFVVASLKEPKIPLKLIDRLLVYCESLRIEPILLLSKPDLVTSEEIEELKTLYEKIPYRVWTTEELKLKIQNQELDFENKLGVVMGQSGVGKSTLLNALLPEEEKLETGEISEVLGRGRHTTRVTTLYDLLGGKLADTPGFSSLQFEELELENLDEAFPELFRLKTNCKFRQCTHHQEPGCAVIQALKEGEISKSRYENYLFFYEEIEKRPKPYERKKKR